MSFEVFIFNVACTVVGGVILTFFFFFLKEKCFALPNVSGQWYLQICTEETTFKTYIDMRLHYIVLLWREGEGVYGTAEKYHEFSSKGERKYIGENRTRVEIKGSIEKNYFTKDRVRLHVVEQGEKRESTNYYDLDVVSADLLEGAFVSMVAEQSGSVIMQREKF